MVSRVPPVCYNSDYESRCISCTAPDAGGLRSAMHPQREGQIRPAYHPLRTTGTAASHQRDDAHASPRRRRQPDVNGMEEVRGSNPLASVYAGRLWG